MKKPKLPSIDLNRLASMKNPLKAAADWAERMAGEVSEPIELSPRPERREEAPPVEENPAVPRPIRVESAWRWKDAGEPFEESAPAEQQSAPAASEQSVEAEAPSFPREQSAAPKKPARRKTDDRELVSQVWSLAIFVGLAGTLVAFLLAAVR